MSAYTGISASRPSGCTIYAAIFHNLEKLWRGAQNLFGGTVPRCPPLTTGLRTVIDIDKSNGKKGKVIPYSLLSVGPGPDPGVQAVSPQVT